MKYRIVADSSSNVKSVSTVEFASAPLKITVDQTTFVDDSSLDLPALMHALRTVKGASRTACPSPDEWTAAFGDADCIFCVTITSNLSGCYNSAMVAAKEYEAAHPGRKVYVVDSLSTGPEMALIIEKLEQLIAEKHDFEEIKARIKDYTAHTHLSFILQSVRNLANNGRLSPTIAKLVGLLGIRMVGIASDVGTLQLMSKNRGDKRGLKAMVEDMEKLGYRGGEVRIHHCSNLPFAEAAKALITEKYPHAHVLMSESAGLCSYYAEEGGLLVGYETV